MATLSLIPSTEESVYDRVVELVFSGEYQPGSRLTERDLAKQLQVSRIPVRESLAKMVAQGMLLGGKRREGVRIRQYTPDEVRELYEFRLYLEVGAARTATKYAQLPDIQALKAACLAMDRHVGEYGSEDWAAMDHQFHEALAQGSHNERMIDTLRSLLTECHRIFYLRPSRQRRRPSAEDAATWMATVQREHRALVDCVAAGHADGAERLLRRHVVSQRL